MYPWSGAQLGASGYVVSGLAQILAWRKLFFIPRASLFPPPSATKMKQVSNQSHQDNVMNVFFFFFIEAEVK